MFRRPRQEDLRGIHTAGRLYEWGHRRSGGRRRRYYQPVDDGKAETQISKLNLVSQMYGRGKPRPPARKASCVGIRYIEMESKPILGAETQLFNKSSYCRTN